MFTKPVFLLFLFFCYFLSKPNVILGQVNLQLQLDKSHLPFYTLNIEDGLSTLFIEYVLQDQYGFIWIGTQYGLNLYDGYNIKIFKFNNTDTSSLSSDFVTKIYEDKDGNIWVCTIRGLCLFNRANETFKRYFPDTKDINSDKNYILGVEEDSKGKLWIFSQNALFALDKKTGIIHDYSKNAPFKTNNRFSYSKFRKRSCEDDESNIWFTSSGGLWKYNRIKDNIEIFKNDPENPKSISSNDIVSIEKDYRNYIWFTTRASGLNRIEFTMNSKNETGEIRFKNYRKNNDGLTSDSLENIFNDSNNKLWITGANGISLYNPNTDKFESYQIKGERIIRMDESILGGYWLKSEEKLFWFDTQHNKLVLFSEYEGFNNMKYKNHYLCNKGCIWTTYEGNGIQIAYSWPYKVNYFFKEFDFQGLPPNYKKISKILIDRNNNLWLGTYNGIVKVKNFLNEPNPQRIIYNSQTGNSRSLRSNNILSMIESSDGNIWIGTYKGLSKYNPDQENFLNFYHDKKNPESILTDYIQDLFEDSRHILWVLTQDGPDIMDRETGIFYHLKDYNSQVNDDFYQLVYEDPGGNIWLGDFEQGITKIEFPNYTNISKQSLQEIFKTIKVSKFKNIPGDKFSLSGNSVICFFSDNQKRFWIGTGNGLNLLLPEEKKFVCINTDFGLENETICGILDDSKGNIWISTKRGISKLEVGDKITSSNYRQKIKVTNFSMSEGLQGLEYLEKSFFKSRTGILFFGGFNGFNFFTPESTFTSNFPVPFLTKFYKKNRTTFFNKPIYELDTITLLYKENSFAFEFVGLDKKKKQKIKYRYMLENFDNNWIDCGYERKANFTNIPPGDYFFKVQASNEFGEWNENFDSILIQIKPPFWLTWWFESLTAVFILIIIASIIKIREKSLVLQKKHLQQEVEHRTRQINNKNEELKTQNEEIKAQRDLLSVQNQSINESIHYAQRIQMAVLPQQAYIDELLNDYFILFKPRDIVSGDFYWVKQVNHYLVIVVADCTGHGVPGALMSMLGISFINEIIQKREITQANQALNELRRQLKQALRQTGRKGQTEDGMDLALCVIDKRTNEMQFAGANNPLYLFKGGNFSEIHGDRMPIGFYPNEKPSFSNFETRLETGDVFYIFTDGFIDQFGGARGFKYKTQNFQQFLKKIHSRPMAIQKELLEQEFENWKDGYEQTDDILILGVKI
ncbi:MAG: two-component regulator propeller domain-containing protein [Bacteroidales bacterium]